MIELTEKQLGEFQEVWKKHNPGKKTDPELLKLAAVKLLTAVSLIYSEDIENPEQ